MPDRSTTAPAPARPGRRLALFLAAYLLVTAGIGWRLVDIQVVAADEYRELAQRQTQREVALPPRRGKIEDRAGVPLAVSVPAAAVYADPRALREAGVDPTYVAADLTAVLERPLDELVSRLTADSGFVYLARQLPRRVGEQVHALGLPGVGVLEEPFRTYPGGSLGAQTVGFSGIDGDGLSGVELAYDELLTGTPGVLRQERAPGGVAISSAPSEIVAATPGRDVVLTLDARIQYTAERLLAEAVERHGARGGSAVVLDPSSGEILAMASVPGYDPADISDADPYERRNRAVTDVFEPGSVAKAVTIAAALEEGVARPGESLEVPSGVTYGGKRFTEMTPQPDRRQLTLTDITASSSNVGTIMLADALGEERLRDYLVRFGFGRPTGLDFPGESAGLLPGLDAWYATSLPTIAIGQGVSATLLQVSGVFATIAAGGQWVEPRLVQGVRAPDGLLEPARPPVRQRVVSEGTAASVRELLAAVVAEGTGTAAAVPGYRVAGKTGTAQKPSETERGYEEDAYISSFVGFAPAGDPALVAAVMIDEPDGEHFGGVVAAPVFSELMEFALTHLRVPPSGAAGTQQSGRSDT